MGSVAPANAATTERPGRGQCAGPEPGISFARISYYDGGARRFRRNFRRRNDMGSKDKKKESKGKKPQPKPTP